MSTNPMRNRAALVVLFVLTLRAAAQDGTPPAVTETGPEPVPAAARQPGTPAPAEEGTTPTPQPSPAAPPEHITEQARLAAANALFVAVFENDTERARELMAEGVDPNTVMPVPVDPAVAELFRPTVLNYFLAGERGLTPLMVAATLGHFGAAEMLLQAGANPDARTKRQGTNALWLAGYKGHTAVTKLLLGVQPGSEADRMRIEVDLGNQTAQLFVDGNAETAIPISSGRQGSPTPEGEFVVTNKHRHWRSTIYGVSMPYYLRLSCRPFGLHAGHLPGYPASHGCIRLHKEDAKNLFERVPVGTLVIIKK
jgi:hypothetical protein